MLEFLVISYSLFALILVVVILSKKGQEEDNNLRRKKSIGKEAVKAEYKNVDTSFYDRIIKPIVDKFNKSRQENASSNAKQIKQEKQIAAKLRKAGLHITASNFRFFKTAFLAIFSVISVGIGLILYSVMDMKAFIVTLIGVMIAVAGPDLYLNQRVKKHQNAIKAQVADAIDLMCVCMDAGLSFDATLVKISDYMEGPFIDELMTVFRQIQLGKNRNDALKDMADATDVPEIKTFASAVIQANQLGIPITNVLNAQAEQLRLDKREEIKTVAAKVPTKMTLPTVIFVLPALLVIILGPVVFNMMETFTGM